MDRWQASTAARLAALWSPIDGGMYGWPAEEGAGRIFDGGKEDAAPRPWIPGAALLLSRLGDFDAPLRLAIRQVVSYASSREDAEVGLNVPRVLSTR